MHKIITHVQVKEIEKPPLKIIKILHEKTIQMLKTKLSFCSYLIFSRSCNCLKVKLKSFNS